MFTNVSAVVLTVTMVVGLAACTAAPPTITPAPAAADPNAVPTIDPNAESLQVEIANTQISLGLERLAFEMYDEGGNPLSANAKVAIDMMRSDNIAEGQTLRHTTASGEALRFGDEMAGGGAWVVYHDFDASGPWSMDTNVTFADGRTGSGRADFVVEGRAPAPKVDERPPDMKTPTIADVADISELTSDPAPLEALYRMSVDEAMSNGTVTVITFGAPGSCPACAATLTGVKALMAKRGSTVDFIHVESAAIGDPSQSSEAAQAWGIPSDVPWTFVLDPKGYVSSRVEGPIGSPELELLVNRATG